MKGYKIYYNKATKNYCYESEPSEVKNDEYNKDTDVSWIDTLIHAKNATDKYNQMIINGELIVKECKECKRTFDINKDEIEWLTEKGLKQYVRCYDCRKKRRISYE